MENKELDEKLAQWRWPDSKIEVDGQYIIVWPPFAIEGKTSDSFAYNIELFTLSVDSCLKWLVPELLERADNDGKFRIYLMLKHWVHGLIFNGSDKVALDLCRDIENLIDNASK